MPTTPEKPVRHVLAHRAYWAAALLGVATMAAVDEIVFHQILAWHHFYDRGTPDIALLSDGLLHAGELFAFAIGFFLMLDARRRGQFRAGVAWSGFFVGLGFFQLFDGVVVHKVLRLHQVRYGVDLRLYDVVWISSALVLLTVGVVMTLALHRALREAPSTEGL